MIRRAVDVVVSALALALSSPVLALAALAIRLESPGPVIYRQRRAGLHGRPFDVLKLRTMVEGAEHIGAGLAVDEDDARITRVGALLRRTSLDELPNLLNVLRGEMSLIGPRPTLPVQVRAVHRAPARAPRDQAGHHRLGAGQRPRVAAVGASGSSSTCTTSSTARSRSTCAILRRTVAMVLGGSGLYKGHAGGWEGEL